jgi:hypothetical protein
MKKYGKKDLNQNDIAKACAGIGCSILDTSSIGGGAMDFIAGRCGKNFLFEVKSSEKSKLTSPQIKLHQSWNGKIYVVWNAIQAMNIILRECTEKKGDIYKSGHKIYSDL